MQDLTETFRPYLEARDWVTINRGTEIAFGDDGFTDVGPAPEAGARPTAAGSQQTPS